MGYRQITQLDDAQTARLTALFQREWWTAGRTAADVRRLLAGPSLVFALADEDTGALVGFARVLTDGVYKALVFDVVVDQAQRGQRLGALLMDWIVNHPQIRHVRHIELYCKPEMVPFYERWGLSADVGDIVLMRGELTSGAVS